MADILSKYGTTNQTITVTLASLANNSAQASTLVDNSTNLFLDALVSLKVKTGASGATASAVVNVYAYGTTDNTTYTENASGTDGAITLTVPTNARLIASIATPAVATTYYAGPVSVAQAFGGVLPQKWGIIVENKTGGALDTTEGNHSKTYQGVYAQTV